MVSMVFNKDEAYLLEKMCDDQSVLVSKRIREVIEGFLVTRAQMNLEGNERENLSSIVFKEIEEYAKTIELLKRIRSKFEAKRK